MVVVPQADMEEVKVPQEVMEDHQAVAVVVMVMMHQLFQSL